MTPQELQALNRKERRRIGKQIRVKIPGTNRPLTKPVFRI